MTDDELVQLAGLAVGIKDAKWHRVKTGDLDWDRAWNPLENDEDALRLIVAVSQDHGLRLMLPEKSDPSAVIDDYDGFDFFFKASDPSDPYATTRRAIVLASAAIGKRLKA